MTKLTEEQKTIHDEIIDWIDTPKKSQKPFILTGQAGTGKTFLAVEVIKTLIYDKKLRVYVACPTGKAAVNFKHYLGRLAYHNKVTGISTIHSMIYHLEELDEEKQLFKWKLRNELKGNPHLIICDEASMITRKMWIDLLSWNLPILAIGDDFQLPPVDPDSQVPFSVLKNETAKLKHIHRQALESPVIQCLSDIRQGILPQLGTRKESKYGTVRFFPCDDNFIQNILKHKIPFERKNLVTLVATNRLRNKLNSFIRNIVKQRLEIKDCKWPMKNDRVIALKNNFSQNDETIMNGQSGIILSDPQYFFDEEIIPYHVVRMKILLDTNQIYHARIYPPTIGSSSYYQVLKKSKLSKRLRQNVDLIDFGYALTVHKSQGSEWDSVVLFNDAIYFMGGEDYYRWIYTGLSRSKKHVLLLQPYSENFG